ncbi:MAG: dihydropteroate synthase [Crocinitomicaceae bacterium]|nr:dihydropteroate synthase [Crocinitomicaceae bacterium]
MGVLNVNFDSFYSSSRIAGKKEFIPRIAKMIEDGMDILDLGAYSSRPGADFVPEEEEKRRLEGVISEVMKEFPDLILSVDTFRSEIARFSVDQGVSIINDISGGSLDDKMFKTIAELKVPYILMHMRGTPQTMKEMTDYKDILKEIYQYFDKKLNQLKELGVEDVVLDLGYGFAKNLDQNYFLLNHQNYFQSLNRPILTGISRKSMIYKLLDSTPEQALNGTSVLNFKALEKGANILRVHDVREAKEVVKIFEKLTTER